jgi:putative transposase
MRNGKLALSIVDTGMGATLRQLAYKAEHYGGHVVKVGRFFASSKLCSHCGHVHKALTLAERQWTCTGCSVMHDRDWNASKNIEAEALRLARA